MADSIPFLSRAWRARRYPAFRTKLNELAVNFLAEASVLVGVLGILDFVIAWRQQPTIKVVGWSLGIAIALFSAAVIMQAAAEPEPDEAPLTAQASNFNEGEETNA